jgi:CBS domain-containing protein
MPTIRTIVRTEVVTADASTTALELAGLMGEELVGSVVIVEDDRPVGIVTDRDLTLKVIGHERDPERTTAADVMTDAVVTVDVDAGVFDVLSTMAEESIRRAPAVDDSGDLAGIVTFDDFVALLGRELGKLGDIVEAESPPY